MVIHWARIAKFPTEITAGSPLRKRVISCGAIIKPTILNNPTIDIAAAAASP
ncbi:hypothetical protein ACTQ6A_11910 [Lachnospiraceae bacterium LCP25S3_G4]